MAGNSSRSGFAVVLRGIYNTELEIYQIFLEKQRLFSAIFSWNWQHLYSDY